MLSYLELIRVWNGLVASFGFLVAAAIAGVGLSFSNTLLLLGVLVVFLQTSAGNAINDYFDYKIDVVNRPQRPIPSKRVGLNAARNFGLVLFVLSIAAAYYLPRAMLGFAIFNALLLLAYSWKLKRTPLGHFIVSWLTASLFLFAAFLTSFNLLTWIVFGMVFSISMVREIAKGIEDLKGDSLAGAKTLEVSVGKPIASFIAIVFGALGIVLTFLPFSLGSLKGLYLLFIIAADLMVVYSLNILQSKPGQAQRILKYVMLLTLVAFIAGLY